MEELNILERDAQEGAFRLHAIAQIFCVLLLMMLLSNPEFTRPVENFFDLLLVPVAGTGNTVCEKNVGNMPDMQSAADQLQKEWDLKKAALPYTDGSCLFTEVAITCPDLMPENTPSDPATPHHLLGGNIQSEYLPDTVMQPGGNLLSDIQGVSEITLSDAVQDPSEITAADAAQDPSEITAADTVQDPSEITVSDAAQDPSEITVSDAAQDLSEITAADTVQDPGQAAIDDPAIQEPLPEQPLLPGTTVVGPALSEELENPSAPEQAEPAPPVSDTTGAADTEMGTEEDPSAEAVSCFLLDESGMLYGFLPEYAGIQDGYLALPEECTGIRSGAFSGIGAQIAELYIPSGVTVIEDGAFTCLDSLTYIDVDGANPVYTTINGVLFDRTATVLLLFPAGRIGTYLLPAQVTQIADGAFTNTALSNLDFRNCPSLFLDGNIFGPSLGNGIVIAVPAESFPVYEDIFSPYAVTLTQ